MENISEKPLRKRGRPPTIPEFERRISMEVYHERGPRQHNNSIYKTRAIGSLKDDPRFEWLLSDTASIMRGTGHMRHTILTELGRIPDEQAREAMALYLCENTPTTRQALAMIREYRLGTRPPGTTHQLADVLRQAINTYLSTHAPLPWEAIRQALYTVLSDIDVSERTPGH